MQADISDFEALQAHASPQSEAVPVFNEVVYQDEGIKLLRVPVCWHIDEDDKGQFNVFEAKENAPPNWKAMFGSLEDAKYFVRLRKMQLRQL